MIKIYLLQKVTVVLLLLICVGISSLLISTCFVNRLTWYEPKTNAERSKFGFPKEGFMPKQYVHFYVCHITCQSF